MELLAVRLDPESRSARSPLVVRTERTGGTFVAQSTAAVVRRSACHPSSTGFFPGSGRSRDPPLDRAQLNYSVHAAAATSATSSSGATADSQWVPRHNAAERREPRLNTSFEAKLQGPRRVAPTPGDTAGRQLALPVKGARSSCCRSTSRSLDWDFDARQGVERRHRPHESTSFDIGARSDLLPGFDVGIDYSLFQGDPISRHRGVQALSRERPRVAVTRCGVADRSRPRATAGYPDGRHDDAARSDRHERRRQRGRSAQPAHRCFARRARGIIRGLGGPRGCRCREGQGWRVSLTYSGATPAAAAGGNVVDLRSRRRRASSLSRIDAFQYEACLAPVSTGRSATAAADQRDHARRHVLPHPAAGRTCNGRRRST